MVRRRPARMVVMPNGFGFNRPGHSAAAAYGQLARIPVHQSAGGLSVAAQAAVRALTAAGDVRLGKAAPAFGASATQPGGGSVTGAAPSGRGTDNLVATVALALFVLAGVAIAARTALAPRRSGAAVRSRRDRALGPADRPLVSRLRGSKVGWARMVSGAVLLFGIAAGVSLLLIAGGSGSSPSQAEQLAFNPYLDPGTSTPA